MSKQATWEELPIEIQKKCLLRQKQLTGYQSVGTFKTNTYAGFAFEESLEGGAFWVEVLGRSNFELFFKKYPKKQTKNK